MQYAGCCLVIVVMAAATLLILGELITSCTWHSQRSYRTLSQINDGAGVKSKLKKGVGRTWAVVFQNSLEISQINYDIILEIKITNLWLKIHNTDFTIKNWCWNILKRFHWVNVCFTEVVLRLLRLRLSSKLLRNSKSFCLCGSYLINVYYIRKWK